MVLVNSTGRQIQITDIKCGQTSLLSHIRVLLEREGRLDVMSEWLTLAPGEVFTFVGDCIEWIEE